MSLINRMLRDLSARETQPSNVRSGIEVPKPAPAAGGSVAKRIGALLVLVAAFTAGLWWMFGPRKLPVPAPRVLAAAPPAGPASTPAATEAAPAAAPVEGADSLRLKMATNLASSAEPAPERAAPPAEPQAPATRAQERPKPKSRPSAPPPRTAEAPAHDSDAADADAETDAEVAAAAQDEAAQAESTAPPAAAAPAAPMFTESVRTAQQMYAEARLAMQRGDTTGAEQGYAGALTLDPKLHAAREDLGALRIRQGRFDEAERTAKRGLEEDPNWPGYRRLLGRLELARGKPEAAVEALERDPPPVASDIEYHALLASAYQRLSRHDDAARAYQQLAQAQPERAQWWAGYGLSRDALGDAPGALAAYTRARQLGGLDPRVLEHINRRSAALTTAAQ